MILLESLAANDETLVKSLIEEHVCFTNSTHGEMILANWEEQKQHFVKIIPKDYKQMLSAIERRKQEGLNDDEAALAAFDEKK